MDGNFVAHDLLIVLEVTLELCGQSGLAVENNENVVTLGLVIDRVGEAALAPLVDLDDLTAVSGDDTVELIDYGLGFLLIKLGHDNIQTFVLLHLIHLLMVLWRLSAQGFGRAKSMPAFVGNVL